jgi:hypothetical protein
MKIIRTLAATGLLSLSVVNLEATAFVIVKTPDGYVVGADSRRVYQAGYRQESVCKIRVNHNVALLVWGGAGRVGDAQADLRALSQPFLDQLMGTAYQRGTELKHALEANRHFQQQLHASPDPDLGWAFVSSHEIGGYQWIAKGDGWDMGQVKPTPSHVELAEADRLAYAYVEKRVAGRASLPERDASKLVRDALQYTAQKEPEWIGGPFSIISITGAGVRWISKGACP